MAVSGLAFGRALEGQRSDDAVLEFDIDEVVGGFVDFYDDYADDDRDHGGDDEHAFVLELRALGWPPLEEMIRSSPQTFAAMARHCAYDLVTSIVPAPSGDTRFFFHDVLDVSVSDAVVTIRGRVIDTSRERTTNAPRAGHPVVLTSTSRGAAPERIVVWPERTVRIGRTHGDVLVDHVSIGRRQSRLCYGARGCSIEDDGSPSGTFLNEVLVREPTFLRDGDEVRLGELTFVVSITPDVADRPEEPRHGLWVFLRSGRALLVEDGRPSVTTAGSVVGARVAASLYAGGQPWLGTRAGLVQLSPELRVQRELAVGPVWALGYSPGMHAIAAGTSDGGHVLALAGSPRFSRRDLWPDGEAATAVCAADRMTGHPDALLWGTGEGRLYLSYDQDHRRDPRERMNGLLSPHDGAIHALAQTDDGHVYCATQGWLWRYDPEGVQTRLERLGGYVVRLMVLDASVLAVTEEGQIVAISGEKAEVVAHLDQRITCAASIGDEVFVGTSEGQLASLSAPHLRIPVADEAIVSLC